MLYTFWEGGLSSSSKGQAVVKNIQCTVVKYLSWSVHLQWHVIFQLSLRKFCVLQLLPISEIIVFVCLA